MVWIRVSSSAVTDGRTNASDTCCRSTSTVALARYRSGSDATAVIVAARAAQKTAAASHLRRCQTSSAKSGLRFESVRDGVVVMPRDWGARTPDGGDSRRGRGIELAR